jgi:D-alanyl-D-alanine carboxypeptidase (penicillin-binding protein 5/6)
MFYLVTQAFCLIFCSIGIELLGKQLECFVNAESAILINADTGAILYEKNSHDIHFPASITKVATALYALTIKDSELETVISAEHEAIASVTESAIRRSNYTLPSYYIEQGSSHIGIKKGEELKFKDLLYGMMLPSANDASNVIAQFVSGSIPAFVTELNEYVKTIGCKNTNFCNPHGLHHPKHVTTAYDMALIAKEAMKHPYFKEVVSKVRYTRPKTNKQEPTTLVQLNKLLKTGRYHYDRAIGIKTGHTSFAFNTFVSAATEGDRTLILVMLKTKERNNIFSDAKKVFEAAFAESKVERTLIKSGKQEFTLNHENAPKPIQTYASQDVSIEYYPSEEPTIKSWLQWETVNLPVLKGQKLGEIIIRNETKKTEHHVPLFAEEDVQAKWFSSWF